MSEALEKAANLVSLAKKHHEEAEKEVERLQEELEVACSRLGAAAGCLESARRALLSVAEF